MKASIVAASALVASVAAFEHKNHAGFHLRRGAYEPAQDEICTVYTTVYVEASMYSTLQRVSMLVI
jgi:hypothetical protein